MCVPGGISNAVLNAHSSRYLFGVVGPGNIVSSLIMLCMAYIIQQKLQWVNIHLLMFWSFQKLSQSELLPIRVVQVVFIIQGQKQRQ